MNPTDQELLELFETRSDQAAFTQLVQRHGPMVMGICLRFLRNEQDAWDTFQTVFLLLARKAGSLHKHPALGGWLHQVAVNMAKDADRTLSRRNDRFQPLEEHMQKAVTPEPGEELGTSLDEELQRLPEKYRFPVVMCHLEKRSYEEAAVELKLSYRTLQRRLSEAANLLRRRLLRRGIVVTTAAVGTLLKENTMAQVPASTALLIGNIASSFTAGAGAVEGGMVSSKVMAMLEVGLRQIWIAQVKHVALTSLVVVAASAAILGSAWHLASDASVANTQSQAAFDSPLPFASASPEANNSTTKQIEERTLFQESFENPNFAVRGWYDNTSIMTTAAEHIPGSNQAAEFHFPAGAKEPTSGGPMRKLFPESDSVFLSYWIKYSPNYIGLHLWGDIQEFLLLTNEDDRYSGLTSPHLAVAIEQNGGIPALWLHDGANVDSSRLSEDLTDLTEDRAIAGGNGVSEAEATSGVLYYQADGEHRNGKRFGPGKTYFQDQQGPFYKGDWHHVEVFVKLNTLSAGKGSSDGVLRYWYDGHLIMERTNIVMRTAKRPTMKFNQFVMAPYISQTAPLDQTFWIDDLIVATERP